MLGYRPNVLFPPIEALDGQLKHEDTNLASSTLIHDPTQKENMGIIVQYKVGSDPYQGLECWQSFISCYPGESEIVPGTSSRGASCRAALHFDAS